VHRIKSSPFIVMIVRALLLLMLVSARFHMLTVSPFLWLCELSHPLCSSLILVRYATASARSDGLLLLCGGRDANSVVSRISGLPSTQQKNSVLRVPFSLANLGAEGRKTWI